MSEEITKIAIEDIKAYLCSLEDTEEKKELLLQIDECERIPQKIEKLKAAKYMAYRAYTNKAEKILSKAIKRLSNRYNKIVDEIFDSAKEIEQFENIEEIDFSKYRPNSEELIKIKEKFKEEFTEEERKALIQKELYIVEKAKAFNTMPIPHEILKNSDREIQTKMKKFNDARQKRLRIMSTMGEDYEKLIEPKEDYKMVEDAILYIETIKYILRNSECKALENSFAKRKKKIYKSSKEIRDIIKYKEKKTGIINYNVQEARYERMNKLGNTINDASKIIEQNKITEAEKQLEKLKASYEKEKQYASIIEKLHEENSDTNAGVEVEELKNKIYRLEERINVSKKVIEEQKDIINNAKKELLILWKIEINSTISKQEKILELAENTEENAQKEGPKHIENKKENIFKRLKRLQGKEEYILRM